MSAPWTLATWNVNSLKVRLPAVLAWLREHRPDVLALQELKLAEDAFPHDAFRDLGYAAAVHGQKTWNGVAILARGELTDVQKGMPERPDDPQARFISARAHGATVINVYVPNGGDVGSDKFAYKLSWLESLAQHCAARRNGDLAMVGDFNVAPDRRDIHDPDVAENFVLFTPTERAALARVMSAGLSDVFRRFHDEAGLYSWWDYRAAAFRRNHGARIDLILASRALAARATACDIDAAPRRADSPSDHAPVVARFDH